MCVEPLARMHVAKWKLATWIVCKTGGNQGLNLAADARYKQDRAGLKGGVDYHDSPCQHQ